MMTLLYNQYVKGLKVNKPAAYHERKIDLKW